MISPASFRELASGRRRGLAAAMFRAATSAASGPYGWAVGRRNARFDRGATPIHRPPAPVISVGNLTVGGSGKTPMVEWICRLLQQGGRTPVILSRGYRAGADGLNDEAMELALALPGVPHLQNPDRSAGAAEAVARFGADVLVLDDGFQHRRLARDLDIVLLDASEPFGYRRLLPRGLLREPIANLDRAHAIVLSRASMLEPAGREAVKREALALCPDAVWCEVDHEPQALVNLAGQSRPVELAHARVAAFAGIGNPAGFRHTLAGLGCNVVAWQEFPDHHAYTADELQRLAAHSSHIRAQVLLTTRKDLVKLRRLDLSNVDVWAVEIGLKFMDGERGLRLAIDAVLGGTARAERQ